jgi:hypothetical protein
MCKYSTPNHNLLPFSIANAPNAKGIIELLIHLPKDTPAHESFLENLSQDKAIKLLGLLANVPLNNFSIDLVFLL